MNGKRVTISDIAKVVGVSVNTVSHALNDKSDISEETKNLIKQTADRMGYIRNSSASFMRSGRSRCISVIVGDISNPHFAIVVKEIERVAKESGYAVFVLNTNEDEALEKDAIVTSLSKNVDGIIICPVQKTEDNVRFLMQSGIPFALVGRHFDGIDTNYVICDDRHGGYLAAEHLINKGHRSIAVFNGPSYISSAVERLDGIKQVFDEKGIALRDKDIYTLSVTFDDHGEIISRAMSSGRDYTAAICFSDIIALEFLAATEGKNIEVISFDDIRSKFIMPTRFASITSSKTKVGHKAFEILMDSLDCPDRKKQHIVLRTKIVER
ncbi:MAG: LacI family DNA-binding transcriptional regulator [Clostridia bacterium]|nr:LacI family DNA-binding transcriptional regulator [Clostridia bacterium]